MTTVRAWWYIHQEWNMLRQLSSSNDNGLSMVINHSCTRHASWVVIVTWQRSEHGNISLRYESSSVICHRLTTTVRAWWYIPQVWNMLRQLSSSKDNGQSMVVYPFGMNHAQSVVIISWQRSEHVILCIKYETFSVSCHRLITTVRAWLYIIHVRNMLRQLSSSHDNGQSMVRYP